MAPATNSPTRELDSDTVLRQEAEAIHGADLKNLSGNELYRSLNGLNSSALCLSGGGIRSATFALGVIEALAVHPRQASGANEGEKQSTSAENSLLSQFNYLSTVSGGGYIGSWLSAWIARVGYASVWRKLIGQRDHPDIEPGETSWLRAYSNYLTPKLGLFSADTWTAIALYIRNLVLNWLVILPALALFLLAVKIFAVIGFWIYVAGVTSTFAGSMIGRSAIVAFVLIGVGLMIYALRFALLNRPSRFLGSVLAAKGTDAKTPPSYDAHRDERKNQSEGANENAFVWHCLLPALAAAFLLALYLVIRGPKLVTWSLTLVILVALAAGAAIYAVAWVSAWPSKRDRVAQGATKGRSLYRVRDFYCWTIAGAVYGALIGLGVYIFAQNSQHLWPVIGNINAASASGYSASSLAGYYLITLIYGVPWIVTAQITAEMIFVGLTNWQRHSDADREWFGRSTGYFTVVALMWLVITFMVLIAAEVLWSFVMTNNWAKYAGSVTAVGSALFSTLLGKSGKSSATDQKDTGMLMRIAVPLAAIVFLIILVLTISYLIDYLLFGKSLIYSSLFWSRPLEGLRGDLTWLAIGTAVVVFVAVIAWLYININRFSIHALYRNRLIRGYLGASNSERKPNPFTGFDSADNIAMWELRPQPGQWRPFHVVNIALNVVNSKRLAWQERKASSFTATPLHCGTAGLGYRRTEEYGGTERRGMSLGTALAISGAAASPSMGYHSSPIVSLLLALFNVRLGWWLGNPGPKGEPDFYKSDGPRIAILPFIREMFGLTTDDSRYVYLSDGGHFENLGLYEMIRRRCRCIVISDAGCDPNFGFEDLGNAVRKIAIDLGVYISFGKLHELKKRSKDGTLIEGAYYAIGEIDYKTAPEWHSGDADAENGYILYIKPGYHGTESAGVVAYATASAAFPHETTGDQFFSESQFESYRTLGFEIMDGVLKQAAQCVGEINKGGKQTLAPGKLCELIRALGSPGHEAEAKPPRVSDALKFLDKDDLNELRKILTPAK